MLEKKTREIERARKCAYAKLTELSLNNYEFQLGTESECKWYPLKEKCLAALLIRNYHPTS